MSNEIENGVKLSKTELRVLAGLNAQARVVELRRRNGGIGHVTVLTHEQVAAVSAKGTIAALQEKGVLVAHYKQFQKIVLPEGVELPAVAA